MRKFLSLITILFSFTIGYSQDYIEEASVTAYIVVVDSSENYNELISTMNLVHDSLQVKVDMLEKIYNDSTNSMILHPQHVDKIYAGTYYPRRSFDTFLSIENVNYYTNNSNCKSMMIVYSITQIKKQAKENLKKVKTIIPKAFILQTKLYIGCMH